MIDFFKLAINEAWKYQFLTYPNPAVGCAVFKDNELISIGAHKKAGAAHAEVEALKKAYLHFFPNSPIKNLNTSFEIHNYLIKNHKNIFSELEIFVTLEPCSHIGKTPSCANLLSTLKPKKVYIGIKDPNKTASGGAKILKKAGIEVEFDILKDECYNLLYPFKKWIENRFIFFKMAIRGDGSNDGVVSSNDSFKLVHQIRANLDLLVIGGETVRNDRPTLDARLVRGKAPDILIYSKKNDFDKTIPLFNVANRKVFIDNKFDLKDYKFIMVEGGYNLYNHLKDKIDLLMLFVSHSKKLTIDLEKKFSKKIIYRYFINEIDEICFLT